MSRLIDADMTRNWITEDWFLDVLLSCVSKSVMKDCLLNVIDSIPLAYDVDKVVEQLEDEREYSYADFEEYVNEKSPCLDAEYDDFYHRGLERAIKIVKAGGTDEGIH